MVISWPGLVGYIERNCTSGTSTFHDTSADAINAVGARQGQAMLQGSLNLAKVVPPPPVCPLTSVPERISSGHLAPLRPSQLRSRPQLERSDPAIKSAGVTGFDRVWGLSRPNSGPMPTETPWALQVAQA